MPQLTRPLLSQRLIRSLEILQDFACTESDMSGRRESYYAPVDVCCYRNTSTALFGVDDRSSSQTSVRIRASFIHLESHHYNISNRHIVIRPLKVHTLH